MPIIIPGTAPTQLPIKTMPYNGPKNLPFWRLVRTTDGTNIMLQSGRLEPTEVQLEIGCGIFDVLNLELAMEKGSRWSMTWMHPTATAGRGGLVSMRPKMMQATFHDIDGDSVFAVEIEETDETLSEPSSVENLLNQCEQAYREYKGILKDAGVTEKHMYRPALGQAPANPDDDSSPI